MSTSKHYEVSFDFSGSHHITTPFYEDRISFGLAKPEAYSSFEKMILPFDSLTWISSICVFSTAFISIFIVNLMPKRTRILFYGKNVVTPALNVVAIFFGISQTKLPTNSFARLILMNFVMFCLVLRAAYQGVLFTMMSTDIGKPLPVSFEDLVSMNYTILIHNGEKYLYNMFPTELRYLKSY